MTRIIFLKNKLLSNHFMKSLSVLVAGTALSNVFIFVTIPILTRLYTPEEFGSLSVFLSFVYTLQIIASLRYETAIPLPKKTDDAFHLLVLSSIFVVLISFITLVLVLVLPIATFFSMPELSSYMWLLSVSVLGIGFYQVLNLWTIRTEEYKAMSQAKVMMNGGQVTSQIMLGLFSLGVLGLLIGEVVGRFSGALTYMRNIKKHAFSKREFQFAKLVSVLKRYKSFPLISSWSSILGGIGAQLPVFFLAAVFDAKTVGLFFLAQKILIVPEGMLGFSASQVYLSQSAQYSRMSYEAYRKFFWDSIKKMTLLGVGSIGLVVLVAPPIIHIVFGDEWVQTGVYIQILAVLYLLKIIISPISANFYVFEALKIQLFAECLRFGCIVFSIVLALRFSDQPVYSIFCMSMVSSLGYLLYGYFSWYVMKRNYRLNKEGIDKHLASIGGEEGVENA